MLIVLDGCVGAGKSTLATGLAAHRGSKLLLEQFDQNPFLPAFYENPEVYALETEFMFLLLHFHQLKQRAQEDNNSNEVLSDFHFGKDLLYAELNFADSEILSLFRQLYDFLNRMVTTPSLLIGLSATTELVIRRIKSRGRAFELDIDPSYYERLNSAYEKFFESYPGRKIIISMDEWDFVGNPNLYDDLSKMVDVALATE